MALRYKIDNRRQYFEFEIDPSLHVRGAMSGFIRYESPFERRFFTNQIHQAVRGAFQRLCPPATGCEEPR